MRKLFAALTIWLAAAIPSSAEVEQRSNPGLSALNRGIDSREQERPLNLSRLDTDVTISGMLAESVVTATFSNPAQEPVEGRFTLQLPKESVATGYALDVGGEMIDGVLLDQPKAREVYTDKVRQGIDPGLAEVSRDAVFSTRVFPIFPGSGRTIRVRFVTPIDPEEGFLFPLQSVAAVPAARVRVRAYDVAEAPRLQMAGADLRWTETGRGYVAETELNNARLAGNLRIGPPRPAAPILLATHSSGEGFFQLADAAPSVSGTRMNPSRIRIYWDRSHSRLDDALGDEAELVRRLAEDLKPQAIDIVQFGSARPVVGSVQNGREAEAALKAVRYRGATSFENLARLPLPPAELCVLFSDGVSTIERRDALRPGCVLHAVTSAADADLPYLRGIASASGGEALQLNRNIRAVVDRIGRRQAAIVDIRSEAGERVDYAMLDGGRGLLRAVGRAPAQGGLVVSIAAEGQTVTRRYPAPTSEAAHNGAAALWASSRIATIAGDPAQAPVFKSLSQRYSVAGPEMAFVVLETPYDYVRDEVTPPDSYPKRLRASYTQMKADWDRQQEAQRAGWQKELVRRWEEQKSWWATRFDPNAKQKPRPIGKGSPLPPPPPPIAVLTAPAAPLPVIQTRRNAPPRPEEAATDASSESGQIVVTGAAAGGMLGEQRGGTQIVIAPWRPDRPYLRAFETAGAGDFDRVFLVEEKQHGSLPAFYLDVSDWLFRRGRKEEAVEVLLSALDLPTANNGTIGIVAGRLLRYRELDRAIYLLERLAISEEFRPQPKRSLALALQQRAAARGRDLGRADLDRALQLLEEVIESPPSGDYQGIEIIALMDANAMLPHYRRLGGARQPLDSRLVALLDVDLRIILEWSSGNNDLDLWVTEPTGERSFFENPLTRLGGRLSNDMSSGYGPEEYLLRRVIPGTYAVAANIYASDRIDPNGAPTVTARLIRDFGRPSQREELVDVELSPEEQGQKPIGRFIVGKP